MAVMTIAKKTQEETNNTNDSKSKDEIIRKNDNKSNEWFIFYRLDKTITTMKQLSFILIKVVRFGIQNDKK